MVIRLNRNRCQYCRFKKCLAVGMSRDCKLLRTFNILFPLCTVKSFSIISENVQQKPGQGERSGIVVKHLTESRGLVFDPHWRHPVVSLSN